jgi:ankyrin repeat protein
MFVAARTNRTGFAARLIALGANLDFPRGDGVTPLMMAGHNGDWRTVRLLLDAGANARAVQADTTMTALHFVVVSGSETTVRMMLSADVDIDAINREGVTPLMYGVDGGLTGTVALLLKAGADPSRTGTDVTPLQGACRQGRLEIANLLLRAGADPTATDKHGEMALHLAITEGHTAVVRLLLTIVDVDSGPDGALTPLFTAVDRERTEIVQVLLEAGADTRRLSAEGWTPLHAAVVKGSVELTRVMLKAGIHPDDLGGCGLSPAQLCAFVTGRTEGVLGCLRELIEGTQIS